MGKALSQITSFFLILTILVWPFGHLLDFKVFGFVLYPLDLLAFVLFAISVLNKRLLHELKASKFLKSYFIFFLALLASTIINSLIHRQIIASSFLYLLRLLCYPSLFILIKNTKLHKKYLVISVAIFFILGLSQYLFMPDMRFLKNLGYDDHFYRLIGSVYDPNFYGLISTLISITFLSANKLVPFIITLPIIALTYSRASYLSLVAGIVSLASKRQLIFLGAALAIVSAIIIIAPKPYGEGVNLARTFSIFSRIENTQNNLALFAKNPIIGYGYHFLQGTDQARYPIDNSFLQIAVGGGVIALVAFLKFLFDLWKGTSPRFKAIIIALSIHSLFNDSFFFIWIFSLFWILVGLDTREHSSR